MPAVYVRARCHVAWSIRLSDGIGEGVAIPHVRIDEISVPTVAVGVSKGGIDFESLDSEPVNIVVLFAMPSGSDKEYLGFLAQVMMTLRTGDFCDKMTACDSPAELVQVLNQQD